MKARRRWAMALAAFAAGAYAPLAAPQLLAFPYHARIGASEVWSETPLPEAALGSVLKRSATLVATSPLARMPEGRHVFLTQGGWRWRWLTVGGSGAFATTRAINDAVLVNRSDLARDRVWNGAVIGGERTLSGVIAHETCHGMERHRFGAVASDMLTPQWLREGYSHHVAQESSLSDADVVRLRATGQSHPALPYYEGRRRVAERLSQNGNNVDALFANP